MRLRVVMAVALACLAVSGVAMAQDAAALPSVVVERDGASVQLQETAIRREDGGLAVPLRPLAEALGGVVQWIDATKEAVFTAHRTVAIFATSSGRVTVNGASQQLSGGVMSYDGRLALAVEDLGHLGLAWALDASGSTLRVYVKRAVVSVDVAVEDGRPRVAITGERELSYTAFALTAPDRVVVDIFDAVILDEFVPVSVGAGGVAQVRAGMNRPGVVRVVADLDRPVGYRVSKVGEDLSSIQLMFNSMLSEVSLDDSSAMPGLVVRTSSPVRPVLSEESAPGVTVISLPGTSLPAEFEHSELGGESIQEVRAEQAYDDTVRIVAVTSEALRPLIRRAGDDGTSWRIDFAVEIVEALIWDEPGATVVELVTSGSVDVNVMRLKAPHRIAIDLPGVWVPTAVTSSQAAAGGGSLGPQVSGETSTGIGLRIAQFSPDTARAVVDLPGDFAHELERPDPCRLRIRVAVSPLWRRRVIIDPGHGGADPGAVRGRVYEKDINLDIAIRLRNLLVEAGAEVVMTRDDDISMELEERVEKANSSGADAFVSIHCNSVFDIFPGGTETFYYNLAPYSQELGVLVHTYLLRSINLLDRKVKSRNLYVLRHTNIPAVLVEVAFLSNDYEFSRLQDTSFREKAAEGIFNGIEAYFRSEIYQRWLARLRGEPVDETWTPSVVDYGSGAEVAGDAADAVDAVDAGDGSDASDTGSVGGEGQEGTAVGPEEEPVDGPTEDGVPEEDTAAAGGEAASGESLPEESVDVPEGLEGPLPERLEESVTEEGSSQVTAPGGDTPESDPPGTDVPHRDEGATEATAGGTDEGDVEAVGEAEEEPPASTQYGGPDGELTNEPGPEPRPEREPEREPASD